MSVTNLGRRVRDVAHALPHHGLQHKCQQNQAVRGVTAAKGRAHDGVRRSGCTAAPWPAGQTTKAVFASIQTSRKVRAAACSMQRASHATPWPAAWRSTGKRGHRHGTCSLRSGTCSRPPTCHPDGQLVLPAYGGAWPQVMTTAGTKVMTTGGNR